MYYRKKPVVIEAIQYDGSEDSWNKIIRMGCKETFQLDHQTFAFYIKTLEGDMLVNLFDWVIKGVKGEFYPCKPDIFEATYEAVEQPQQVSHDSN